MPDIFIRELRHALRRLRGRPGFTLVVILTLALGIGANTAIFSLIYALLLRPFPYESPDRLVRVRSAADEHRRRPRRFVARRRGLALAAAAR